MDPGARNLLDRFAELPAAWFGEGHDLGLDRGRQRRRRRRGRFAALPRRSTGAGLLFRLPRRRRRADEGLQRRPRGVLLGLLLARAMAGAQRLRAREYHRRVLAPVAHTRAFAVVDRRLAEAFLRDLLQPTLEVLV